MKLEDAETLARLLMAHHGLIDQGWVFRFDRGTVRFGNCHFGDPPRITLSRHLVELNDEADVEDTIRHEIAHALAGLKAGHGPGWQAACALTGARPERLYGEAVVRPPARWFLVCPRCHVHWPRQRRTRNVYQHRSCGTTLVWKENGDV